ncbi:hypothetical protein K438DRAFT_1771433 [Mycena galopus ATCC 62051]|nr:hypothetical protein K438DRAFT_1771433 [Mycena galopus ATCC 62051]
MVPSGHILVRADLDLWIITSGYKPHHFYGATLPTPPPPPPVPAAPPAPAATSVPLPDASPSRVPSPPYRRRSRAKKEERPGKRTPTELRDDRESGRTAPSSQRRKTPLAPQQFALEGFRLTGAVVCALHPPCKYCGNLNHLCTLELGKALPAKTPQCCSPCNAAHATCSRWTKSSDAYEGGDDEILRSCVLAASLSGFLSLLTLLCGLEFLSDLCPAQHTARAETCRKTAKKASRRHGPTVIISSGSEDENPVPKKRKTSRSDCGASTAPCPEIIVVDEEEMPAVVDDLRNYNLGDGDVETCAGGLWVKYNYMQIRRAECNREVIPDTIPESTTEYDRVRAFVY